MLMFTEQSLSLQLTVTETLIKVSRYHALPCFPERENEQVPVNLSTLFFAY